MFGELRRVLLKSTCVTCFQSARDLLMEAQTTRSDQLRVQRLSHERMCELVHDAAGLCVFLEHAGLHGVLQRRSQMFLIEVRYQTHYLRARKSA